MVFVCLCVCLSAFSARYLTTTAAMITILDIETWKLKRSQVKVTKHKKCWCGCCTFGDLTRFWMSKVKVTAGFLGDEAFHIHAGALKSHILVCLT